MTQELHTTHNISAPQTTTEKVGEQFTPYGSKISICNTLGFLVAEALCVFAQYENDRMLPSETACNDQVKAVEHIIVSEVCGAMYENFEAIMGASDFNAS